MQNIKWYNWFPLSITWLGGLSPHGHAGVIPVPSINHSPHYCEANSTHHLM